MLGMIFGVAAVVSMLSIGAGARQKVMAVIEQMGVHNLIVEAKETMDWQAHQNLPDFARPYVPGLPRHFGQCRQCRRFHASPAVYTDSNNS